MTITSEPPVLSARRRWTILAICASALFLVGLDTTIVAVGLREIGRGLEVDAPRLSWVIDAYTVTFASLLITAGALADRFGRRRVFLTGLTVFALSSLACALAPSLALLVAARVAQGVGASMLTPVALSIVVAAMPDPRERAQAIGVWGAMFGLSMAAGPVTGGALLALFDWRALFWINVPIVVVAIVLVRAFVPESRAQRRRRIDLPGQLLLVALLWLAITLLIEGPHLGWTTPLAITGYIALAVVAVVFIRVESRRREPLMEPTLFLSPGFAGSIIAATAVFVAFSMTLLLTTLALRAHGWSPIAAGAATLPMALGATLCAPISGYLVGRTGPRLPLLLAGGCLTLGGLALVISLNLPLLLTAFLLIGTGLGFANAPITNTAVSGLPPERAGVAAGTTSTARQFGVATGVALAGTLVADVPADELATAALPGWLIIAGSGTLLLAIAATNRPSDTQCEPHAGAHSLRTSRDSPTTSNARP